MFTGGGGCHIGCPSNIVTKPKNLFCKIHKLALPDYSSMRGRTDNGSKRGKSIIKINYDSKMSNCSKSGIGSA